MKRIIIVGFILVSTLFICSCDRQLISSGFPNVVTLSAEDRGDMVVFSGELKNDDGTKIDEVGFIWQNNEDPFTKPGFRVKSEVAASGFFTAEVTWSVTHDKNFILRAYAKCGDNIVYGEALVFRSDLSLPCQLFRIEPDSAFRGDTIKLIGQGFNRTLQYNKVVIGGKNSTVVAANDTVLTCIVPADLAKGSSAVTIVVNGVSGDFPNKFRLLLPPPPQVVTKPASAVSWFTATTEGTVDPNGAPCAVSFEYGLTPSYGQGMVAMPGSVSGDSIINVSATLRNLSPNSVYHFRIKATSESGTAYGDDLTFRTSEAPPIPVISSLSATTIKYGNTLTVYGQNMNAATGVLLGSTSQSITVTPKNVSSVSMEIEVYNQQNPSQLPGFSSFRVGLVYPGGVSWSDLVVIGSSWMKVADLPALPRYKAGCFTVAGKIYIGCGASNGTTLRDFWRYDPQGNSWSQMADFPGVGRIYAIGTADDSYGYMGTGHTEDNASKIQLYDFYKYNPGTGEWSAIPNYPDPINNFFLNYGVSVNGHAYVSLSNAVQNTREIIGDSWVSHPNVTDLMNSGGNAVFVFGNLYYVVCGYRFNSNIINKAVWEYNTLTSTWTRKADFPGPARNLAMFFSIGDYGYMGCGTTNDNQQFTDMWRYDPANDKWIRIEDFPGGMRSHGVSASAGSYGFAGLGVRLGSATYYNDFWKFDPLMH
ncbi:MAG TPA: kelch repeat-containing protein [Bacteroidales bacterium]|nr:kelch repeat-containing protein [Bacteroidales bacterium]